MAYHSCCCPPDAIAFLIVEVDIRNLLPDDYVLGYWKRLPVSSVGTMNNGSKQLTFFWSLRKDMIGAWLSLLTVYLLLIMLGGTVVAVRKIWFPTRVFREISAVNGFVMFMVSSVTRVRSAAISATKRSRVAVRAVCVAQNSFTRASCLERDSSISSTSDEIISCWFFAFTVRVERVLSNLSKKLTH